MAIKTYNDQNFVAIANAIRSKNGETTQYKPSEMAAAISAIESGLELLPQDTVSGAIANFPDGSNNYPVVELIANIDYKQEGYTGMNITKQRKNLADGNMTQEGATRVILIDNIFLKAGSYTISLTCDTARHFYYRVHGTSTWTLLGGYSKKVVTFTIDNNNYYDFSYYHTNGVTISEISDLQLEVGSSATDFEPYSAPEVKSISWESEAGTVYGGSLNVTAGELTSTLDSSGDPLPTPEVYQLEPEEVKTLLGVNNIYADTGDVEVTYRADIDLYIAKKIAEGA